MEMRERNQGFGIPSPIGSYQPPPQPIQESSSPRLLNTPQALGPHHHHHHHNHLLHQDLGLQQQEAQRDQNPDPDPAQLTNSATINPSSVAQTPLPTASASATSSAAAVTTVQYRECLKNHAASMGSHILDGCGEFMPSGEEGTTEALKCAACACHRSFHRKEIEGESPKAPPPNCYHTQNPTRNGTRRTSVHPIQAPAPAPPSTTMPTQQQKYLQGFAAFATSPSTGPMPPIMMAFGGTSGAPTESSSEDLNVNFRSNAGGVTIGEQQSRKRFRTKFSQEQKDRMQEFAEKLGWRIQKQDEQEVHQFCNANGVKRQVFKVWMHNNKQAMKKKQL